MQNQEGIQSFMDLCSFPLRPISTIEWGYLWTKLIRAFNGGDSNPPRSQMPSFIPEFDDKTGPSGCLAWIIPTGNSPRTGSFVQSRVCIWSNEFQQKEGKAGTQRLCIEETSRAFKQTTLLPSYGRVNSKSYGPFRFKHKHESPWQVNIAENVSNSFETTSGNLLRQRNHTGKGRWQSHIAREGSRRQ